MELDLITNNVSEQGYIFVRIIQMIMVPLFGVMTLIGIFLFLYSFKNPIKRRLAYLFCVFSPIGFILFLHGVPLLDYYVFRGPYINEAGKGFELLVDWVDKSGSPAFSIFVSLIQPILIAILIIGLGILHASAKTPGLRRLGTGVVLGVPFLWGLIELGPSIYRIFIS